MLYTVSSPFVHKGGSQLRHCSHGQKHDTQEGHAKEGPGTSGGLVNPGEQRSNNEGHDDNLDQPAYDKRPVPQCQGPLPPEDHLQGFVPCQGVLVSGQGIRIGLIPAMQSSHYINKFSA